MQGGNPADKPLAVPKAPGSTLQPASSADTAANSCPWAAPERWVWKDPRWGTQVCPELPKRDILYFEGWNSDGQPLFASRSYLEWICGERRPRLPCNSWGPSENLLKSWDMRLCRRIGLIRGPDRRAWGRNWRRYPAQHWRFLMILHWVLWKGCPSSQRRTGSPGWWRWWAGTRPCLTALLEWIWWF